MKIYFLIPVIVFLFSFSVKAAADSAVTPSFEGEIKIRLEGKGFTNTSRFVMKGSKMMMKPGDGGASTNAYPIIDFQARRITLLSFKNKTWFGMSMDALEGKKQLPAGKTTVTLTGNKDVLCGYPVEEWLAVNRSENLEFRAWGTSGIKTGNNLMLFMQNALGAAAGDFKEILSRGQFPMKIQVKRSGADEFAWEVTAVLERKISDREFDIPPDFISLAEYVRKKNQNNRGR